MGEVDGGEEREGERERVGAKRCRKRREDDSEEQRKRSKRGEKRVEVKPRSGAGVKQMQESVRGAVLV